MRVQTLDIHNFRGFETAQIRFGESNVSVFIGTNGQGKSTILDLLAIHLQQFTSRIAKLTGNKYKVNDIKLIENDIRVGCNTTFNSMTVDFNPIVPRLANGTQKILTWSISKALDEPSISNRPIFALAEEASVYGYQKDNRKDLQQQEKKLFDFVDILYAEVRANEYAHIPILIYYQSNLTVFSDITLRENPNRYSIKQFEAYDNAFVKKANDFQDFAAWFRKEEDKENEMKVREKNFNIKNPVLQVVRDSIEVFFSNNSGSKYNNLRVEREDNQGYRSSRPSFSSLVITKDTEDLKIEQLSDGEKNLILLVSDIARRLAIANPNKENALDGEGIVLIDEVELHLHPTWQREVLNGLQKTFKNIQFIVTTHSPLVLANLNEGVQIFSIKRLQNKKNVVISHDKEQFNPYGSISSRILRLLMGTNERPAKVGALLRAYEEAIDDNRLELAERLEAQLKELIDPNDPDIIQGAATIEAKRILQEV